MLLPKYRKNRITDISAEFLKELGVKGIILDVDNTLTKPKTGVLENGVGEWLENMKREGFAFCIASNSMPARAKTFAKKVNLPLTAICLKPLPSGILRSVRKMGLKRKECILIGDQIFTDALAAKFAGVKMCLTEPFVYETAFGFRIKRKAERIIKERAEKK